MPNLVAHRIAMLAGCCATCAITHAQLSPSQPMGMPDPDEAWVLNSGHTAWYRTVGGNGQVSSYSSRSHTRDPRPVLTLNFWRPGPPPIDENYFDLYWLKAPDGMGDQPDLGSYDANGDWDTSMGGNGVWDGIDDALHLLDSAYDRGWRRIQIRYPGGFLGTTLSGSAPSPHYTTGLVSMTQWWHLPDDQRTEFENTVGDWIDTHTDVQVTLYLGRTSAEAWNPCRGNGVYLTRDGVTDYDCTGTVYSGGINNVFPESDPENADFMERAYQNLKPWFDMGVDGFCFDNYSGSANVYFQDFRSSPNWNGASYLASEAFILDNDLTDGSKYDVDFSEEFPQVAYSGYLASNWADIIDYDDETIPGHLNYSVPSGLTNTEYLMVHQYVRIEVSPGTYRSLTPNNYCIETVASYPQGGYVVGAFLDLFYAPLYIGAEPNFHRMTRLIYDFDLANLDPCDQADVNGDGCVNIDDFYLLSDIITGTVVRPANPGPWSGSGPFDDGYGIYHGDINDDGAISAADSSAWIIAYNLCSPATCSTVSCP